MTNAKFPVLHQVTVEFIGGRPPLVYELNSFEEAQRCLQTVMQNPEAWHVFHSIQKHHRGKLFIQVSFYRSQDTKEWQCSHRATEGDSCSC